MFVSRKLRHLMMAMFALILSVGTMWAQNINVTGTVTDKSGDPLVGVYVVVRGTQTGTATDIDGFYTISVPANGTLEFTSMGYKTATVAVAGRAKIDVVLEDDALLLEDAVVTALGIKKERKSLGYAVEDLKSEELMKIKTANPISSLDRKSVV